MSNDNKNMHSNVVGQQKTCAAESERDRKAADYDRLAGENARLTRERDEARAQTGLLREIVLVFWRFAGVADAAEGEPWKVNETNGRLWQMRHDLDAATARAEALATQNHQLLDAVTDAVKAIVNGESLLSWKREENLGAIKKWSRELSEVQAHLSKLIGNTETGT